MLEMYTNANLSDSTVGMSSLFYKMNKKFLSWKEVGRAERSLEGYPHAVDFCPLEFSRKSVRNVLL